MFGLKIINSKANDVLLERIAQLETENADVCLIIDELETELAKIEKQTLKTVDNEKLLKIECNRLNKLLAESNGKNSVTIIISDDLSTITPIIRHRADVFETIFQNGYLNDSQNSKEATELAMLTIANDGLTQLLSEFVEPFKED